MFIINIPFTKTYRQKCPDGSIKRIYRNVDKAFPLFIPGWKGDISADIKAFEQIPAAAKAAYESKVQGLLYSLDERNNSLMMSFRTVYIVFQTDPCSNNDYFQRKIDDILVEQRQVSLLKLRVQSYIELIKVNPKPNEMMMTVFGDIVQELGGKPVSAAAVDEVDESRELVKEWIKKGK